MSGRHAGPRTADEANLIAMVLDSGEAATVVHCLRQIYRQDGGEHRRVLADRMVAQSLLLKPVKPPEPQGLGAVVVDAKGVHCVRADTGGRPWVHQRGAAWVAYDDIDVVKVLSEGVTR